MRLTQVLTRPSPCQHISCVIDLDGNSVTLDGWRQDFASGRLWEMTGNDPRQALALAWLRYKLAQGLTLEQLLGTEMIMRTISNYNLSDAGVMAWANMPAALTEFRGVTSFPFRIRADLSAATQVRTCVRVTTAGATGAELRAQYSTD